MIDFYMADLDFVENISSDHQVLLLLETQAKKYVFLFMDVFPLNKQKGKIAAQLKQIRFHHVVPEDKVENCD